MLKSSLLAIGGSVAISILSLNSAAKAEPDYLCYMLKPTGQTVDLSKLCKGPLNPVASSQTTAQQKPREVRKFNKGGSVNIEAGSNVQQDQRSKFWYFTGRLKNNTTQTISNVRVTWVATPSGEEASFSGFDLLQPGTLQPGETGTFRALIPRKQRPSVNVSKVEWTWEDGTRGSYP